MTTKPKTHLCNSDEPLKEGEPLTAICGQEVPRSRFVFMWDDVECSSWSLTPNVTATVCNRCSLAHKSKRYIYGVRTREDEPAE